MVVGKTDRSTAISSTTKTIAPVVNSEQTPTTVTIRLTNERFINCQQSLELTSSIGCWLP